MDAPKLAAGEVHVWTVPLDGGPGPDGAALSEDERARAERYLFPADAARYTAARAALRAILARYVGTPAATLAFSYGAKGKPELAGRALRFNLSHSAGLAAVAVCLDREVGVDVERLRPVPDAADVVGRFLSPAARRAFARLAVHERDEGFLRLWTRQEAYLKARGDGLSGPLDEAPDAHWQVRDFVPAEGYLGALALRGRVGAVKRFDWLSCSRSSR